MKFRHRFRHTYGDELRWDKMKPLLEEAPRLLERLKGAIEQFFTEMGRN